MSDSTDHRNPDLFAEYAPRSSPRPRRGPTKLHIRPSIPADCDALAEIAWMRQGGELAEWVARMEQNLTTQQADTLRLTALSDDRPVAYATITRIVPPPDAPANHVPAGFYLGGVTVRPECRRQGIGHELTRLRLEWISQRAHEAFYFVNAQNRASIDLHARFGFVELTRDFFLPGASFVGGVGVLFRVNLTKRSIEYEP